jgi:hypothetical protein
MSESFLKSDKLNRVKSQVKEWSLYTKFDCYSKIFQTKNVILKLVWLIFFSHIHRAHGLLCVQECN